MHQLYYLSGRMSIMGLNFRSLVLEDKKIFDKFAMPQKGYLNSELNFATIWLWDTESRTQIHVQDDLVIVRMICCDKRIYFPPLCDDALLPHAVDLIAQESAREGMPFEICGLTEKRAALLDRTKHKITTERWESDYLYNAQDLITLVGKKFHSKRNFVTRFRSAHQFDFRAYDEQSDRENILGLFKKWNETVAHETWAREHGVILRALDNWKDLDLKISVLYVDGILVAFSAVQATNSQVGYTYLEKADTSYVGVYQMINQLTAIAHFQNVKYINRQDDMGIEGLRKAKMSYNPVMLIDKYRVKP